MDRIVRPGAQDIRAARSQNPRMRERDLALKLGISEAELVAAHCGESVRRIEPRVRDLLGELPALGEVMTLTRNDSAVHETIGTFGEVRASAHAAAVLGDNVDLRVFFEHWVHGFAVEKRGGEEVRRSLQFFDAAGEAVHKIHLRPASDLAVYEALVENHLSADQSPVVKIEAVPAEADTEEPFSRHDELRALWRGMTDVHQFYGMLKTLGVSRHTAVRAVGEEYAWPVDREAIGALLPQAAAAQMPIMCFVGSRGCAQIYTGPVSEIKAMGPWLNVLDETFHLHLRTDHIAEVWALRRPIREGPLTTIDAYDAQGQLIIQFFGERHEGEDERQDWRALAESLPRLPASAAA